VITWDGEKNNLLAPVRRLIETKKGGNSPRGKDTLDELGTILEGFTTMGEEEADKERRISMFRTKMVTCPGKEEGKSTAALVATGATS